MDMEKKPELSRAEKEALSTKVSLVHAYKATFGTEDGKKVLHDILKRGHIMNADFVSNPQAMAYNEGMRSMGIEILKILDMDMNRFLRNYYEGVAKERKWEPL